MIKFYDTDFEFQKPKSQYVTKITIEDADTLAVASRFENACCLNFASHKRPGGGYESVRDIPMPIKTQEEDLFRRSNLPELMDIPEIKKEYPLKDVKAFYTNEIVVVKDKQLNPCTSFSFSMITMPAVVNPKDRDKPLLESKVRRILDIAAEHNHKELILGAWGCGVFNNNPKDIADFFCGPLLHEFSGVFETVIFAIPGKNSKNYEIFESAINEWILFDE